MTLEIRRPKATPAGLVADRRLYLTSESGYVGAQAGQVVVEDGDPRAAFLFATPGVVIPADEVARLRLEVVQGRITQRVDAPASADPAPAADPVDAPPPAGELPPTPPTAAAVPKGRAPRAPKDK